MYAFNPKRGQKIQTHVEGVNVDQAFGAHIQIAAADAVAASSDGVLALTNLAAAAQEITAGITSPAVPRNIRIDGNVSGIAGNVTITGTNYKGEAISEEIAANGTTAVDGALAFKTVTQIDLPAQTHTPVKQVETVTVTAGATQAGTLVVTVTAAGLEGGSKEIDVDVTTDDNEAAEVAAKVRAALAADTDVSALYDVGGEGANIVLTDVGYNANDATLAITMVDAPATGVTFGASQNTQAGVAPVAQVETVEVTAGSGGAGTLIVTVTSALLDGGAKAVNVSVTADDDQVGEVAAAIRAALTADTDIAAHYTAAGEGANVVLTALLAAANDETLAIALTDADGTGVTFGASANTTPGVAPVSQIETVTVTAGATEQGIIQVTVTAAGMANSPKTVEILVDEDDDTADAVAAKVRTALEADDDVSAFFTVGGVDANVTLTAVPAANDGTMAIALTDAPATGVTFGASANTTAGVPYDQISVGWGDKLGLPYMLSHNTVQAAYLDNVKETTAPTVTTDADEIEKNTIDLHSALDGSVVDVYLIV